MIETTMEIERNDECIEVTLVGKYWPGSRGVKAHPMDRFAPPDDEPEIEIIECTDSNGDEVDLTDDEIEKATSKLFDAGAEYDG